MAFRLPLRSSFRLWRHLHPDDPVRVGDAAVRAAGALAARTFMPDIPDLNSADFCRRIRRLARQRGWRIEITEGSRHTKVRLNDRATVVPRHSYDLPGGTLRAIISQLGLTPRDLE